MGEGFTRQRKCSYRSIDKSLEYDRWKNDGRDPPNFGVIKIQRWAIVRLTTDDCLMLRVHGPSIAEAYSVWVICCHLLLDWAKMYGCRKNDGGDPPNFGVIRTQTWAFVRLASYR